MRICTFFGHKDAPEKIKPMLKSTITDLIEHCGVKKFYVGNHGNFDFIVQSVLKELSSEYSVEYNVVLSHIVVSERKNCCGECLNTVLPEGIESVPPRFSILYCNKWMIEQSDYVITYVSRSWGGAAKFREIAIKKGKTVLNIAES